MTLQPHAELRCDSLLSPSTDRVTFQPGSPQNVTIGANETVQALLSAVPVDVAFVTLQFHTRDHNATLSYSRVRGLRQGLGVGGLGAFIPLSGNTQVWATQTFTFRLQPGSNLA